MTIELMRISNDVNGNPRYVVHFFNVLTQEEQKQFEGIDHISQLYAYAINKAKKIGGKKYHTKKFGGGLVFQSYNTKDLIKQIEELANE